MESNIVLNLTLDQTNLILTALAELTFKVSAQTIQMIQTTANEQLNPAPEKE